MKSSRKELEKHLVLTADEYEDIHRTKYIGLPVVRYLCMSTRVLKMIRCLTGSQ